MHEDAVIRYLIENPAPLVFDVGANIGQSIKRFRTCFPKSRICSFEPDPDSYRQLSATYGETPEVSLYNVALGDKDGVCCFYRNRKSVANGFLPINTASSKHQGRNEPIESIDVETMALDGFMKDRPNDHIDILKLDCQGGELKIFQGAEDTLKNNRVSLIEIEIMFGDYYGKADGVQQPVSFSDVERLLHPMGYRIYALTETVISPVSHQLGHVSALYVSEAIMARKGNKW